MLLWAVFETLLPAPTSRQITQYNGYLYSLSFSLSSGFAYNFLSEDEEVVYLYLFFYCEGCRMVHWSAQPANQIKCTGNQSCKRRGGANNPG